MFSWLAVAVPVGAQPAAQQRGLPAGQSPDLGRQTEKGDVSSAKTLRRLVSSLPVLPGSSSRYVLLLIITNLGLKLLSISIDSLEGKFLICPTDAIHLK